MRYEFHPDALMEYEEAARYYAGCQEGLELRFMAAVEHAVQQIIEAPERWRILEEDIRSLSENTLSRTRRPTSARMMDRKNAWKLYIILLETIRYVIISPTNHIKTA